MNDEEIRKALDDIAALKKSVHGHWYVLRPILLDRRFIPLAIVFGLFFIVFFSAVQILINQAGSFIAIKIPIKLALAVIFFGILGFTGIMKYRIISKSINRHNRNITWWDLLHDSQFRNLYVLIYSGILIMLVVGGYVGWRLDDMWILLPFFAFYYGGIISLFTIFFFVPEYIIISGISIAFGFISLMCMKDNQFIWLACYFGVLFLSFGIVVACAKGNRDSVSSTTSVPKNGNSTK